MTTILDIIGSIVFASLIILIGLRLNMTIAGTATAASVERDHQELLVNSVQVMERDLRKMGFGLASNIPAIAIADSNRLRFRADMEGDGIIDSVEWYLGTQALSTSKPGVKMLYRRQNGKRAVPFGYGTMTFTYRKQNGAVTTNPGEVKNIEINLKQVSEHKVQEYVAAGEILNYPELFWRQTRPVAQKIKRRI